jgi:hypothetical protein
MTRDPLEHLLGRPGRDPGCEAAFEQFDRYCDAVRRGGDAAREFPDFVTHISNCAPAARTPKACSPCSSSSRRTSRSEVIPRVPGATAGFARRSRRSPPSSCS